MGYRSVATRAVARPKAETIVGDGMHRKCNQHSSALRSTRGFRQTNEMNARRTGWESVDARGACCNSRTPNSTGSLHSNGAVTW